MGAEAYASFKSPCDHGTVAFIVCDLHVQAAIHDSYMWTNEDIARRVEKSQVGKGGGGQNQKLTKQLQDVHSAGMALCCKERQREGGKGGGEKIHLQPGHAHLRSTGIALRCESIEQEGSNASYFMQASTL